MSQCLSPEGVGWEKCTSGRGKKWHKSVIIKRQVNHGDTEKSIASLTKSVL